MRSQEVVSCGSKERRATRRFLMRLPLTVRWTDESVVGEAATESREVSSRGLYFHLPKGLRSGAPVEIVMTLPHELTQAGPVPRTCAADQSREFGRSGSGSSDRTIRVHAQQRISGITSFLPRPCGDG